MLDQAIKLEDQDVCEIFKVSTGRREGPRLLHEKQCGTATYHDHPNKSFYEVNLWMMNRPLYICKNKKDPEKYTVFTHFNGDYVAPAFKQPVGRAEVSDRLKTHMEISLTFPRQWLFMSLFPNAK